MALISLLLVTAGGVAWLAPPAQSHGKRERSRFDPRCRPSGARLVVARYVRAYYDAPNTDLVYCRPGRAEREITLFDIGVYPPPAISLAGPYLGYAGIVSEPATNDSVVVVDLRRNEDVVLLTGAGGGVGSLAVNRRGSVAWIVCPFGHLAEDLDCTTATGERRDLSARSIYRHDSRSTKEEPAQLVARSRRIEIGSLRRKGDRISWKHAGRTRSASLR